MISVPEPKMTSRIVFVLFAVQLLSAVAGVEVEHQAAYDRVLKCINEGFHAGKQEALKEESQPLDKKALLCHFWKVCTILFRLEANYM